MKRKIPHVILIFFMASLAVTLPSCRSSKKGASEFYEASSKPGRKGSHEHERGAKVARLDSKTRKKIVSEAMTWKGTPYGYGKAEKGKASDCSGMVMSVYEKVTGIKLPRNSAQQQDFCKDLKKKNVEPGDLCFFATGKDKDKTSHVGIMVDDRNFIHASTSKGVVVSDITQPYYVRTFKGYGRVPEND